MEPRQTIGRPRHRIHRTHRRRGTAIALALAAALTIRCGGPDAKLTQSPPTANDSDAVRLLISGNLQGRLEPCGCASGQLGGLARRWFQIGERHDLLIEGGNLVADSTPLAGAKTFAAMQCLFGMERQYDAMAVGPDDLQLDWDELADYLSMGRVVASDLRCADQSWTAEPFLENDVRGIKVRIASLTTDLGKLPTPPESRGLELLEPAAAWQRALAGAAPTTLRILLVHGAADLTRRLAVSLRPPPDLVVGLDPSINEPPGEAELGGAVPIVFTGVRGRVMLDLSLSRSAGQPRLEYRRLELHGIDGKPGALEDASVRQILLTHRLQVKEEGILQQMAGQLPTPNGASYVGSAGCSECHEAAYRVWQGSRHAAAWTTLENAERDESRYGWPVTHYPDCVSCHVVGYRQHSGFSTQADTPHLGAVGCERCHGPGSKHVDSEGKTALGKVGAGLPSTVCTECHDFDQSPAFDYTTYWGLISHGR
ncbi:MAG: hypothetical protein KDC98_15495 [Planctomycetes bacterium]|nr:hypothetical protein [Planctomycetota bacterium]